MIDVERNETTQTSPQPIRPLYRRSRSRKTSEQATRDQKAPDVSLPPLCMFVGEVLVFPQGLIGPTPPANPFVPEGLHRRSHLALFFMEAEKFCIICFFDDSISGLESLHSSFRDRDKTKTCTAGSSGTRHSERIKMSGGVSFCEIDQFKGESDMCDYVKKYYEKPP